MNDNQRTICAPNIDTTSFQNQEMFYEELKYNFISGIHVSIPCKIISYDRDVHLATVQVMYLYELVNGKTIVGPEIKNIELIRIMAGGFLIDFPIKAGDTGWLLAVDRDCYDIKRESSQRKPASSDINGYKTGFWIPDQWGSDTKLGISGVDANRLTIQSKDGTQKVSIGASDISITATTLYVNGNLEVTGKIKESGTNVTLGTHTHTSSQSGSPTSAPKTGT